MTNFRRQSRCIGKFFICNVIISQWEVKTMEEVGCDAVLMGYIATFDTCRQHRQGNEIMFIVRKVSGNRILLFWNFCLH